MAKIKILNQTEPTTPDTGSTSIYVDSADKKVKYKDDTGNVSVVANEASFEASIEAIDQSVTISSFTTGEDLTENDAVFLENMVTFASAVGEGYIGYDASTTRQAIPVIGNGETTIEVKLSLKKVGSPSADLVVRIETDDEGEPSGELLEIDSHGAITAASLTTSLVDTTVTLTGACVPLAGVKYWIVLNQAADVVNSSNYYMYGFLAQDSTTRGPKVYGGVSWGSRVATVFPYVLGDGFHTQLLSKTDSDYAYKIDFLGFAYETKTVGQTTKVVTSGIKDGFTGLTANSNYYLSQTPGVLTSTSSGTYSSMVGLAVNTTSISKIEGIRVGSFSKNMAESNIVQTIAHGLGRKPRKFEVFFVYDAGIAGAISLHGVYNGVSTVALVTDNSNPTETAIDTTNIICYHTSPSNKQVATCTFDRNNIYLTRTMTGSPTGTLLVNWIAE